MWLFFGISNFFQIFGKIKIWTFCNYVFFDENFIKLFNVLRSKVFSNRKYKICDHCLRKLSKKFLSLLRVLKCKLTLRAPCG